MTVYTLTKGWYRMFDFTTSISKESRSFFIGLAAAILCIGGFYGYRMYRNSVQESAAKILNSCFQSYQNAKAGNGDWQAVSTLCQLGLKRYSNTSSGPFFLAFHVDALIAQGQMQEARQMAELMIKSLPSSSPLVGLFTAKLALIKLDSADVTVAQQGLTELQSVAQNPKNAAADMARYYLGLYYASIGDITQARSYWQSTVDLGANDDRMMQSPWVYQAQAQLT